MTQLHYANQNLELADDESAADVKVRIEAKVRERGGWVDVKTVDGEVSLLVSTGVPIFVVDRRRR
ncbi:MAG: hypothetical protein ABR571_15350 [Jatrophihabitans sp.]|uniref:hypothetical protein n=1 Tax=Jatrophihabitans sp. TaxID=1932789 RepID=UPI0039141C6D